MKDVNRPEVEHIVSLVLKELGHDKPASALRQDHHPERLSEPPESTDPDCIYFSEEKEWGIERPQQTVGQSAQPDSRPDWHRASRDPDENQKLPAVSPRSGRCP